MTHWWKEPCTLTWSGPPWNRWTASSKTHMGYLGFGATAREAVEQMREQIVRQPVNCAWNDGRPIGALGADGKIRTLRHGRWSVTAHDA